MHTEQPHANHNGTPETEHIFVKNMPNLVHSSKCVWVTMVTVYGTTSPTQKRMHVIIWDQMTKIDVPAMFHCAKVKLLRLLRPRGRSKQNMFWPTQNRCSPNQTRCSGESCSSSYQPNAPLVITRETYCPSPFFNHN